ncbi:hypothetical protein [Streptomyces sp. A012304]|uniref:hypothetical protein n=1 Tax=Streptomyces sp. A012304 TaxID=375446 RepID=UPI00222ED304|nr:hypothetical protein [Streptomyces sp. A012304]GKQ36569.1 hypothetical protein ALMP_31100 [Streptomyces sp. A012304]
MEGEIGVDPSTDFITGDLYEALLARLPAVTVAIPQIETAVGTQGVEAPPLSVQGQAPASGLFSFDKYSSLPLLIDAVRQDVDASGGNDTNRLLFVVPEAHVIKVHAGDGVAQGIEPLSIWPRDSPATRPTSTTTTTEPGRPPPFP